MTPSRETPGSPPERRRARLRAVLDYVDAHLDEDLDLARLSAVARLSEHHFHREFSARYGLTQARYVALLRLRRAAFRLAYRPGRILDVALASHFGSHEAFARAFKRRYGQTPSAFRRAPAWERWGTHERPLQVLRSEHMPPAHDLADVRLTDFPETRVAALEHRGDPARIGETIRAFIAWRRAHGTPPSQSRTFNVWRCDPRHVAPADFRLDLCAEVLGDVAPNAAGVVATTIPALRCARLRHTGGDATLPASASFLVETWLPQSGESLGDFPLFFERVRFFPDVPEAEAITDVFLPLEARTPATR